MEDWDARIKDNCIIREQSVSKSKNESKKNAG